MFSTHSKIFVTGATGFVGSYIVEKLLSAGYDNIFCLTRNAKNKGLATDFADKVFWLEGDILNMPLLTEQIADMEIVIHAAAIVTFRTKEKKKILETAMDGTANLVNASIDRLVKKFVHISSTAAIGRRKKEENIDEKMIFSHSEFDTTYGLSKFLAEQEVWRGHAEGLNTIILNPSMVIGAGNWEYSSPQIFKKIYEGMKYYPEGINGWVDVRDVAKATILALKSETVGKRYIISSENVSYKYVFETIAQSLKVKGPTKKLNMFLAGILWRWEAFKSFLFRIEPVVTKETIKSTSVSSIYDNNASIKDLEMEYISIVKSIEDTAHSFLRTWPTGVKWSKFHE